MCLPPEWVTATGKPLSLPKVKTGSPPSYHRTVSLIEKDTFCNIAKIATIKSHCSIVHGQQDQKVGNF